MEDRSVYHITPFTKTQYNKHNHTPQHGSETALLISLVSIIIYHGCYTFVILFVDDLIPSAKETLIGGVTRRTHGRGPPERPHARSLLARTTHAAYVTKLGHSGTPTTMGQTGLSPIASVSSSTSCIPKSSSSTGPISHSPVDYEIHVQPELMAPHDHVHTVSSGGQNRSYADIDQQLLEINE